MSHRIGCVSYATEQGLGYLMKWFYDAGVVTHPLVVRHPRHPQQDWYPNAVEVNPRNVAGPRVDSLLCELDAVLFFETPFDWKFPLRCAHAGVRTVMVPMHEWFPEDAKVGFDAIVAPSLLDKDYFPGSEFLEIPLPPDVTWECRERPRRFLHNAGHVGHREHKGTRQLLQALKFSKAPFVLTVRCQYPGVVEHMAEAEGVHKDWRLTIRSGSVPRGELFKGFDVYVAPEKLNGLSLPLREAWASGLAVVTSDRYPHNTWLPTELLVHVDRYDPGVRVGGGCMAVDEAVIHPRTLARHLDVLYEFPDISAYSLEGKRFAERNSWANLKDKWLEAILG